MQVKSRLEKLLSEKESNILRYLNSLIRNNLRNRVSAQEVLDDAVCYLMEHPEQTECRSDKDLFLFLLWKSKKLVIDRARQIKTQDDSCFSIARTLDEQRWIAPSPSLVLHRLAKQISLRDCLNSLPSEEQKTALRLMRIEGLTSQQAAKRMGKTPEAVRKLVERGFASLVERIKGSGAKKFATTGETT